MQLFRLTCSTDHKARPSTTLTKLTESDSRECLIDAMNKDVAEWQLQELEEDCDDDEDPVGALDTWAHEERWEMKSGDGEDMRSFVWVLDDDRSCLAYHIVD